MNWKRMLAYITGSVDQELLLRNEYLVAENRILRGQIAGRLRLKDDDRITLAEIGKRLGRKTLAEIANIVTPETILAWHRRLVARKFDGRKNRKSPGRSRTKKEIEQLVVRLTKENPSWGYDRIAGALGNLGIDIVDQTVGNILRRHGIVPAPDRRKETTWREFIETHMDVLGASDFFTAEVWTMMGLVTYYVLFFIHMGSRKVHIAGITPHPDQTWMKQIARNITMTNIGFLNDCRYLIHDRNGKYTDAFGEILKSVGICPVKLPPHSPNLNAFAERFVRSVKEECLDHLILFGERSLRHVMEEYATHYHGERNHQGKGNVILFPDARDRVGNPTGSIRCREHLGGLLKFYHRKAG